MCGISFLLTLIRECFTFWMPAYFADMGASASAAAFKSAVFPLLGCGGTIFAGWYSDRALAGRRGPIITAMLIGLVASLVGLGMADHVARFTHLGRDVVAVALVGLCGLFLLGPYSMIGGGVVALDFGGRATAGTAAGLLDSAGYLGATLAGIGVAQFVSTRGWSFTFLALAALAGLAAALCVVAFRRRGAPAAPAAGG
jgi:sugar phosphate permease